MPSESRLETNGTPWWIPTRGATPSTALVPQEKAGFPIPNPRLLLGFQGTKTARREGISSPFSDAGGCTSCRNSGIVRAILDEVIGPDMVGALGAQTDAGSV